MVGIGRRKRKGKCNHSIIIKCFKIYLNENLKSRGHKKCQKQKERWACCQEFTQRISWNDMNLRI